MNNRIKSSKMKFILIGVLIVVLVSMVEVNVIRRNAQGNEDKNQAAYGSEKDIKDEAEDNKPKDEIDNKDSGDDGATKDKAESGDDTYDKEEQAQNDKNDVKEEATPEKKVLETKCLYQGDGYPSGCEIFSTAMLLNYYGYSYSIEDITKVLPMGELHYEGNERVGPSPYTCFIGKPDSNAGYCCYEPVIEGVLEKLASDKKVENATGNTIEELCTKYIDKDIPVVVWAAVGMQPATDKITWRIEGTNEYYSWPNTEHCLLLVGYDENSYYFNDPMTGAVTGYDKSASEARYSELGKQAVTIY